MKTLYTALGGAFTITWQGGKLYANFNESVGGGKAAGLITGQATICIGAVSAIENLGEAELNALIQKESPTLLPFVQAVESFGNAQLAALG